MRSTSLMRCLQKLRKAVVTHFWTEDKALQAPKDSHASAAHTPNTNDLFSAAKANNVTKKEHSGNYHGDLLARRVAGHCMEPKVTPHFHIIIMWANCPWFCLKSASAHKMTPTGNNYKIKTSEKTRTTVFLPSFYPAFNQSHVCCKESKGRNLFVIRSNIKRWDKHAGCKHSQRLDRHCGKNKEFLFFSCLSAFSPQDLSPAKKCSVSKCKKERVQIAATDDISKDPTTCQWGLCSSRQQSSEQSAAWDDGRLERKSCCSTQTSCSWPVKQDNPPKQSPQLLCRLSVPKAALTCLCRDKPQSVALTHFSILLLVVMTVHEYMDDQMNND